MSTDYSTHTEDKDTPTLYQGSRRLTGGDYDKIGGKESQGPAQSTDFDNAIRAPFKY